MSRFARGCSECVRVGAIPVRHRFHRELKPKLGKDFQEWKLFDWVWRCVKLENKPTPCYLAFRWLFAPIGAPRLSVLHGLFSHPLDQNGIDSSSTAVPVALPAPPAPSAAPAPELLKNFTWSAVTSSDAAICPLRLV